jgi:hypothetical protein
MAISFLENLCTPAISHNYFKHSIVNNLIVQKRAIKFLFTRCYNVLEGVYYFKGHEFSIKP